MTQIVVTLEKGADANFLRRMIENMHGVLKTTLSTNAVTSGEEKKEWTEKKNWLSDNFDKSAIDYDDDRVKYILSK